MNWYARYAGDYMQDTAHLSLVEHGAYTLLLDQYYGSEKPLPSDMVSLYRICRAFSTDEQKAVDSVAEQYFPVNGDGLRHNRRADREIEKRNAISHKRSMAGVIGADGKWHGKRDGKCHSANMANATTTTPTSTITTTSTSLHTPLPPCQGEPPPADIPAKRTRFVPPTIEEVREYCRERSKGVDADKWHNYYAANGWKVGRNSMKDWKAAVRTWENKRNDLGLSFGAQAEPGKYDNIPIIGLDEDPQ